MTNVKSDSMRVHILVECLAITKLSRVDWLTPLISDNLLTEMPLLLHSAKILLTRICAYCSLAAI